MPAALAGMLAGHGGYLLGKEHLVKVVHLLVAEAVIVVPVCVFVDGAGGIQLESLHAHIHKGLEMVGPVLEAGLGAPFALGDEVFFDNAMVVLFAEPEAKMYSHAVELAYEQAGIVFLGIFFLLPVGFRGETVVVPLLFGGEVVALLHPLRFEPEKIHGDVHLAEVGSVAEDGPLVFAHIGPECESVGPLG